LEAEAAGLTTQLVAKSSSAKKPIYNCIHANVLKITMSFKTVDYLRVKLMIHVGAPIAAPGAGRFHVS
jgi:hypothetical protein